ncbi:MAG: hypothetical protein HFJ17_00935 [Clostridia bacterium]|nr:hypothetical protein [Clostridia bacterium]
MNQILSVEMPKKNNKTKIKNNKADIKTIIIFFCVILIIFAIIAGIVGVSFLVKGSKKNEQKTNNVITGTKPSINVEISGDSTLNIVVTHDKQIAKVAYYWNSDEPIEQTNIGQTTCEIPVEIPAGTNILNVNVTDINGVTQSYAEEHTGSLGPSIILEQADNNIKVTSESDNTISYISYNWDGGEEKQLQINDVKTQQLIPVMQEGEHTLNVTAVDAQGNQTKKTQTIKGDNKPVLNIKTDKINLFIEASDDEGLTKMTVNLNGQDLDEKTINDKQFNTSIPLQDGENRVIITVYNINGVQNVQRVRIIK